MRFEAFLLGIVARRVGMPLSRFELFLQQLIPTA